MRIQEKRENLISFQKIRLNEVEYKKAMKLLTSLPTIKTSQSIENIKLKLFDIFDSHIQNEVFKHSKFYVQKEDFLQTLYLKFFELLDQVKNKTIFAENFITTLNDIKPSKNDFNFFSVSLNRQIGNTNSDYSDLFTQESLPVYASQKNAIERRPLQNKLKKLSQNVDFNEKEIEVFKLKKKGMNFVEISKQLDLSETTIRHSFLSAIAKIQKENNLLPKDFKKIAEELIQEYGLDYSIDKIIEILVKNPDLINFFKNNSKKIDDFSTVINISKKDFILTSLNLPSITHLKPETIKKNIVEASHNFGISQEVYTGLALKEPHLFIQKSDTIKQNLSDLAKNIGIGETDLLKVAMKQPKLFIQKPETISDNISKSAIIFNISEQDFIKSALRKPALFYLKPENLQEHIKKSAKIFNLSEQVFINLALKQPNLFIQKPETLKQNVLISARNFNISEQNFIKIAIKRPELFYMKPETIRQNVSKSAEVFNISESDFFKAAVNKPQLFYQKPETLRQNIEKSAKIFNLSEQDFIKAALKQPSLFYQNSETLKQNLLGIAKLLDLSEKEFIDFALKQPMLFQFKPESIAKKVKINNFYHKIHNKNGKKNIQFIKESTDKLYLKPLIYLIRNNFESSISVNQKNLIEVIQSNPDKIYTFNLPQDECTEEFIQYIKDFFAKNIKTQNYKFFVEGKAFI